ncbi:MAG TPA: PAS domain-containing protein, partial [Gemmatimonadaceae bacterium]|nr:PAS domain-containing protein [Gemmatimonadaceae bacterium]
MRLDAGDRRAPGSEPSAAREAGDRLRVIARRRARLAPALVLASLVLLAILPVLESYRMQQLWRELTTVIEPARSLVTRMQAALALEAAGTRGYLLTGEPRFAERFARARESRRSAEARLLPLARRIDPAIAARVEEMTRGFRAADAVLDSLYAGHISRQQYLTRIDAQQSRFQGLVDAAARLDDSIGRVSDATRERIRRTGLTSALLTIGLVLLAVSAAALVSRLGEALTESEERFRQTAENIDDLIWLADPGLRRYLFVNAAYERIWGRTARSLYEHPESWMDAVHPDDRERVRAAAASAAQEGAIDLEFRVVRPDGEIR